MPASKKWTWGDPDPLPRLKSRTKSKAAKAPRKKASQPARKPRRR